MAPRCRLKCKETAPIIPGVTEDTALASDNASDVTSQQTLYTCVSVCGVCVWCVWCVWGVWCLCGVWCKVSLIAGRITRWLQLHLS